MNLNVVDHVSPDENPMPWPEVAKGLKIRCRKTVAKLVKDGHLQRVPGIRHLLIVRESYRRYVAGKSDQKN